MQRGADPSLLWPPPRRVEVTGEGARLPVPLGVATEPFEGLAPGAGLRADPPERAAVRCTRDVSLPAAGYRLACGARGIEIAAPDAAGARHALATLAQLVALAPQTDGLAEIPGVRIEDAPGFATRGALLDVSRGRIPTSAELASIADRLAAWKQDHLQLYCEHAFTYRGHEEVGRDASPLTSDEVRALDGHCARLGIELAPNQQSFGHFHRWLKHARYRELAEVPEGLEHAFSLDREPYSLDLGDPRATALLADLYDQLLPCFRSRTFNVGLDETFDLGRGRSAAACAERGTGRVYLEHLRRVHALVTARGRRMQFWGDVIVQHPELVPELPRDLVALEWGYEAGHPFAEHAAQFARSGLESWVCPGTSSWQSFAGRARNALANQREAAVCGSEAGARGYLVTDWGDRGHHQPHCVRDWGLFAAAGQAWSPGVAIDEARLARLLDAHVYRDAAGELGTAAMELANAYLATGSPATNGSALFFLVAFAPEEFPHPRTPNLAREGLESARSEVERALARVDRSRSSRDDAAQLVAEMRWAGDILLFAADLGLARLDAGSGVSLAAIDARVRAALAERLRALVERHSQIWLARDRPGGLGESTRWFERVLAGLLR